MFFKIWKLRRSCRQDWLVALRSLDAFMGILVLHTVLSGQSFISPSKIWHLFLGGLIILAVKTYFEKQTNYETVYLAFTMQFIVHLALYQPFSLTKLASWFFYSMATDNINIFMKFSIGYIMSLLILLFIFSALHFYLCIKGEYSNLIKALKLRHLIKTFPYPSVQAIKDELYQQCELNDILIMPFVFLIPAVNKGLINKDVKVISSLTEIARELSRYATPRSLKEANLNNLLDLIEYFWSNNKKK